jgi:hypothetical protein
MKSSTRLFAVIFSACCPITLGAQEAAGESPPAAPASSVLSAEQMANLLRQLAELENTIAQMRSTSLSTVLDKLRAVVGSESAALSFFVDCEKKVMIDRRDVSRDDAKRMAERIERANDRKQEGDIAVATKLNLQYLILTLEAAEAGDTPDHSKMVPKLRAFAQEAVAAADKLKGPAFGRFALDVSGPRHPVVAAYQIQRYVKAKDWPTSPADFSGMWSQVFLPASLEHNVEELPAVWDQRISAELALRKGAMSATEFEQWLANEAPVLRWERAEYLYANGIDKVAALADMFKLIRDTPQHADAPKWLAQLRRHIAPPEGSEKSGS